MILQTIDNFLTEEECDYLVSLIDKNNHRSSVAAGGTDKVENTRTSNTSNFSANDKIVKEVHQKIAKQVGKDIEYGESLQGQKYEVGQYFRPHYDWFEGASYENHCGSSGNRTHTLMIYLNDDFEGGATDFPRIKFRTKPKKGQAVFWNNLLPNGKGDQDVFHEGMDVTKGTKYIVTSWWRENHWDGAGDARKRMEKDKPKEKEFKLEVVRDKTFKDYKTLPRLSEKGYEIVDLPEDIWKLCLDMYDRVKPLAVEEKWQGKEGFITGEGKTSELMSLDNTITRELRNQLHQKLLPMHQQWCGEKLEPTFIYGIRSYLNRADLKCHVDRIQTHHISSIIMVDKDLDGKKDWPLDLQMHNGEWEKVYLEPGQLVLYESAVCQHGRKERFQGNYYRNFYVHYKFKDWKYVQ